MAEIKWIKVCTDIFDDEKILLIESMPDADAILVIWFKLLTFAGKQNNHGILTMNDAISYNDEMLATIFRRPLNTVRLALETFKRFGMIEEVDGTMFISNWEKHQNIEGMDKIREQTRKRVQKHRQKQKLLSEDVTLHNVTVTQQNRQEQNRLDKNSSSSYVDLMDGLTADEIQRLYRIYQNAGDLIDKVNEQVQLKDQHINKPYQYIVGYAENVGWSRNG